MSALLRLILRSAPKERVSKGGAATCFEMSTSPFEQGGLLSIRPIEFVILLRQRWDQSKVAPDAFTMAVHFGISALM